MKRIHTNILRTLVRGGAAVIVICIFLFYIELYLTYGNCSDSSCGQYSNGIQGNIDRLAHLETVLEKRFTDIFGSYVKGFALGRKLLLYKCDSKCQTEVRFQNGLLSALFLSVLSDRGLSIYTYEECSVFSYYDEKDVNWKFKTPEAIRAKSVNRLIDPGKRDRFYLENFYLSFLNILEEKDLTSISEDVVVISGDYNLADNVRRHTDSFEVFPQVRAILESDLIRLVMNGLLRTPEVVQKTVNEQLLQQMNDTDKLVCFHSHAKFKHADKTSKALMKLYQHGYKFLFSGVGINNVSENVITLDMNHIERRRKCPQSFDNVVKGYVLKLCDVLVTTNDPVGISAAQMRINSRNLFCCNDVGVIYPCTRELISDSFRDRLKIPIRMNTNYLVKMMNITIIVS